MCPPTLDDSPIMPTLAGAEDLVSIDSTNEANVAREDLIQVYDVSTQQPKTITVLQLLTALNLNL